MKSKMPDNERVIEKQLEERFSLSHVHMQSVSRSRVNGRLLQIDFSGIGPPHDDCRIAASLR